MPTDTRGLQDQPDPPALAATGLCAAWCLDWQASVRCHKPAGHEGPHRSDGIGGQRFSWEPINFDPFAHTGVGYE